MTSTATALEKAASRVSPLLASSAITLVLVTSIARPASAEDARQYTQALVEQYNRLRANDPGFQEQNLQMVRDIMSGASQARKDLAINDNTNYAMGGMMDRARGGLNMGVFGPINGEHGNPFMNAGPMSPGQLHEFGKSISNSPRPCAPGLAGHVNPLFGCSTSSSYPSGHTSKATGAGLLAAYLFPERFQPFITRSQEYAESRIVAGQHYALDVMAARAMTYKAVADLLAQQSGDPNSWLNTAANPQRMRQDMLNRCGGRPLQACADSRADDFSDHARNKAFYNYTKYYGFAPIGPTDKPMVVPENAEYLIRTRFPYLTNEQLREIIRTTADPSGQVLDDPWSRINLFAAADGYARLDADATVTMDAAKAADQTAPGAGYNALDTWRNDIGGTGRLTKAGSGSLTLAGDNSFGGFTLGEGTLTLTGTNTLSGSSAATGGKLVIDEGSLATAGDLTLSKASALSLKSATLSAGGQLNIAAKTELAGSAAVSVAADRTGTVSGEVTGAGGLVKRGAGRLNLDGVNSYSGGTRVDAGTLGLGTSTAAGTGIIALADKTTLAYANGIDVANRLLLEGLVDLDVAAGRATQSGAVGGTGNLAITGGGRLDITGDMSGFIGTTEVSGTTVVANNGLGGRVSVGDKGVFASNGPTTATVNVGKGGTLQGAGSVGTTVVEDGGTLAPGNSVGTLLSVNGDLSLSQGSALNFDLGTAGVAGNPASGTSDRIDVAGTLTLDGTLNLAQSGNAADGVASYGYYRLMNYSTLIDNGLVLDPTLALPNASYELQTGNGHLDLFVGNYGDTSLQHWTGGTGIWSGSTPNWSGIGATVPSTWNGGVAVFRDGANFAGGTVAVEGSQSFKGLQFVDDGYRLGGTGSLLVDGSKAADGNAEIRVLGGSTEIATTIAGAGGLTKTQGGTLVLSGSNTYGGGTRILGGTLSVSSDDNLGGKSGRLEINNGTLATTSSFSSARSVEMNGKGAVDVAAGTGLGLTGTVGGAGGLVKRGEGRLDLDGVNSYSGGTRVEAGTLGLGTSTAAGTGDIALADRTTLAYADGIDVANRLLLEGLVNLNVATGRATQSGAIGGSGTFAITGSGRLDVTGDLSGFDGTTDISGTTVVANNGYGGRVTIGEKGTFVANGPTIARVDVGRNGTLKGSGSVGTTKVGSGGTLSPGNSIGTLNVLGDLDIAQGSTYEVEVDPSGGASDRVKVSGVARIEGGSVRHVGLDGAYAPFSTYRILSADGGVTGRFAAVTSDYTFLVPDLDYSANAVDLTLERNDVTFASVARTRNQAAVAGALDAAGSANVVYSQLVTLDPGAARDAFDSLAGDLHSSVAASLLDESGAVRTALSERLHFGGNPAGGLTARGYGRDLENDPTDAATADAVGWGTVFGNFGDRSGNDARLDVDTGGMLVGFDLAVLDNARLGVLGGYSHASYDAGGRSGSASSDNYHLGLYGAAELGGVTLSAGTAYAWHAIESERSVAVGETFSEGLSADYDAHTFQVFGEAARAFATDVATFEPYANAAFVRTDLDGFSESGSVAALTFSSQDTDATFTTLGLRASRTFAFGGTEATVRGMAGWRHAFDDRDATLTRRFATGPAFDVAGAPIAEDAALVSAGVDFQAAPAVKLGLSYNGQFGGKTQVNGFDAKLSVGF